MPDEPIYKGSQESQEEQSHHDGQCIDFLILALVSFILLTDLVLEVHVFLLQVLDLLLMILEFLAGVVLELLD